MRASTVPISDAYRDACLLAVIQQVPVALMALLMLDGGAFARACGTAMLGFWAMAAVIAVRRPTSPSRLDLAAVRWGFWPILLTVAAGARYLAAVA